MKVAMDVSAPCVAFICVREEARRAEEGGEKSLMAEGYARAEVASVPAPREAVGGEAVGPREGEGKRVGEVNVASEMDASTRCRAVGGVCMTPEEGGVHGAEA